MARSNAQEWAKRVQRWRDSGLTAKEFAAEAGLNAGTLSHWAWKLRAGAGEASRAADKRSRRTSRAQSGLPQLQAAPRFVELCAASVTNSSALELIVGDLRVRVPAGFDEETLARVLRAVGACQ